MALGPWRTPEEVAIARRVDSCPKCGAANTSEGELTRWACGTHVWKGKRTVSKECQERADLIPVAVPGISLAHVPRPPRIVFYAPSRSIIVYNTLEREAECRTRLPDGWKIVYPHGVVFDRVMGDDEEVPAGARLRLDYWRKWDEEERS